MIAENYQFEHLRKVEAALRSHPNAGREITRLAAHVEGGFLTEKIVNAQKLAVGYVADVYQGNPHQFIEDYSTGKITWEDLIKYRGRKELNLALL